MTEEVEHSAVVALRRLSHPERDGRVIPERGGRAVVEDDQVSELIRHLSEIVAFIERRTAEPRDDGAAQRPTESVAPADLVPAAPTPQGDDTGKVTISLRFDTQMLACVDAAARRQGVTRTAWLQIAASERLENRR